MADRLKKTITVEATSFTEGKKPGIASENTWYNANNDETIQRMKTLSAGDVVDIEYWVNKGYHNVEKLDLKSSKDTEPSDLKSNATEEKIADKKNEEPRILKENPELKQYTIDIQGKKFIKADGLMHLAHKVGVAEIKITHQEVNWEAECARTIVTVKLLPEKSLGNERYFTGSGSATPQNCSGMVKKHFVEMSETRAVSRALRKALNVDMVSAEEITKEEEK